MVPVVGSYLYLKWIISGSRMEPGFGTETMKRDMFFRGKSETKNDLVKILRIWKYTTLAGRSYGELSFRRVLRSEHHSGLLKFFWNIFGHLFFSHIRRNFPGNLSALSADSPGELDILGHDGDTLGVDGAQVGVLEQTDQVGLGRFLEMQKEKTTVTTVSGKSQPVAK